MKLGFVSAILPDMDLREVLETANRIGYSTVEIMCWPVGKAERRYAGVTHIDVEGFDAKRAEEVRELVAEIGVDISALGYYPNPLSPHGDERRTCVEHLKKVIHAANLLGLANVNTFVGRDWSKTVDQNWPMFLETWKPIVGLAEELGIKVGIENCPMLFSNDEWPGGKNLAVSPAIWTRMFDEIGSANLGLNYDPSHMIWQFMDPIAPIRDFRERIFHVHAKDLRIDREKLDKVGILGFGWNTPKLPGMGDVDWSKFFSALTDIQYRGAVCVEVEDRAFEDSPEDRKRSLIQSYRTLSPYFP
jgi:sugar phosphate isomerase/epimerase